MNKALNRVEIAFWDTVTPLLSDNLTVRAWVRVGYQVLHSDRRLAPVLVTVCGALGLLAGFVIGRAGLSLW
jgi:hypothetical protein